MFVHDRVMQQFHACITTLHTLVECTSQTQHTPSSVSVLSLKLRLRARALARMSWHEVARGGVGLPVKEALDEWAVHEQNM